MSDHTHPRLEAFHDGELSAGETARVEAHVSDCAECQGALEEMRTLDTLLAEPVAAIPAGFVAATRALAFGRRLPEAPFWWLALPAPWRAGLAAQLLVAAVAGVRLGETVPAGRSDAAELAAALDSPATDAMLAPPGLEVPR